MGFLQICAGVVLLQLSKSAQDVPDAAVFRGDLDQVKEVAQLEQPEFEPKADAIRGAAAIVRRLSSCRREREEEESRRVVEERMQMGSEEVQWDGLRRRVVSGMSARSRSGVHEEQPDNGGSLLHPHWRPQKNVQCAEVRDTDRNRDVSWADSVNTEIEVKVPPTPPPHGGRQFSFQRLFSWSKQPPSPPEHSANPQGGNGGRFFNLASPFSVRPFRSNQQETEEESLGLVKGDGTTSPPSPPHHESDYTIDKEALYRSDSSSISSSSSTRSTTYADLERRLNQSHDDHDHDDDDDGLPAYSQSFSSPPPPAPLRPLPLRPQSPRTPPAQIQHSDLDRRPDMDEDAEIDVHHLASNPFVNAANSSRVSLRLSPPRRREDYPRGGSSGRGRGAFI